MEVEEYNWILRYGAHGCSLGFFIFSPVSSLSALLIGCWPSIIGLSAGFYNPAMDVGIPLAPDLLNHHHML